MTPDDHTYMSLLDIPIQTHDQYYGVGLYLRLEHSPFFWVGVGLWEFVHIQPTDHLWGKVLMLNEKIWLIFGVPIYPKGVW